MARDLASIDKDCATLAHQIRNELARHDLSAALIYQKQLDKLLEERHVTHPVDA